MLTENKQEQSILLEKISEEKQKLKDLKRLRTKSWERFLSLGQLPTKKSETYAYVPLNKLYQKKFGLASFSTPKNFDPSPWIYPESADNYLVFINGMYAPALSKVQSSTSGMQVLNLEEASKKYSTFLSNRWSKAAKEESDPLAALNGALTQSGCLVYLPQNFEATSPIQILHVLTDEAKEQWIFPRIHVVANTGVHAQFITRHISSPEIKAVYNSFIDFSIESNAHLTHSYDSLGYPADAWLFDTCRASLKRDASFKSYSFTAGSESIRGDYAVSLEGENAYTELNKVWMLKGKNQSHSNVLVEHKAPNCTSRQLFKGVIDDHSRSSFEGKILVRQAAQKTNAYQMNNNLVLHNHAIADSKPNLEIFADDVKASHGSTVGQLDRELLFYLQARGILPQHAKDLLVYGFCKEVISLVPHSSIKEHASQYAQSHLSGEA